MSSVNFVSSLLINGLVGGVVHSGKIILSQPHLSSMGVGVCYWIVDSLIEDSILETSREMSGLASIDNYPKNKYDKVVFIAAHTADFAFKAFISLGIGFALGIVSKPIFSAVLILAISTIASIQFQLLVSKKTIKPESSLLLSEEPANDSSIKNTGVAFADVMGCDQAIVELQDIVDYLKNPQEFENAGIKAPKGVLLSGPPGTGKTLLGKAIAGEAKCSFVYKAASEFKEKYIGEGEKNVRNLFKDARAVAPCIIFIDELDAIAKDRSDDEGRGTRGIINQFLTEMDGFSSTEGVIIIAATNRIDELDEAFIRSGRFDRKIAVDLPDSKGRLDILRVHAKKFALHNDVKLEKFAADDNSEGLSGADLECVLNEAALLVRRERRCKITNQDMEQALRRVVHGIDGRLVEMEPEGMRKSAIRQAGRAIVNLYLGHSSSIQKIRIDSNNRKAPNNKTNDREREIWKKQVPNDLVILMSSRAAEYVFCGDISSSTGNDQSEARALLNRFIHEFGVLEVEAELEDAESVLESESFDEEKNESIEINISEGVNRCIQVVFNRAKKLIEEHKEKIQQMVDALLEFGELEENDLIAIKEGRWNPEIKRRVC